MPINNKNGEWHYYYFPLFPSYNAFKGQYLQQVHFYTLTSTTYVGSFQYLVEQIFYTIYLLSAYIRAAADPPPNSS